MIVGRYAVTSPAIAPPKMYVNINVKMIGWMTTSNSCSGLCFDLENSAVRHRERVREALLQADAAGCGIPAGLSATGVL